MPDILLIPSTADQDEIVTLSDRHLNLGDMLVMHGRVYGLVAHSTMALSGNNCMSRDRRYFASMDALIRNQESPCSNPESAARYICEMGIVPGDAEIEWKTQRIAKHYRKDRKLKKHSRKKKINQY
jgi:hypothetical protein